MGNVSLCLCVNTDILFLYEFFIYLFLSIYLSIYLSFRRQICPANFSETIIATVFKFGVPMHLVVNVGMILCVVMMFEIMQISHI